MNLICPCGKPATWYLIYGCEENHHVWEAYFCRECLYATVGFPKSYMIRDQIYACTVPWTCMNIKVSPDMRKAIPKENWELNCEVTSWYAREITPDMLERIKQDKLEKIRATRGNPYTYH